MPSKQLQRAEERRARSRRLASSSEIERALEEDGNALEEDGATLDEDGAALLGVGRGGEEDGAALLDEDRQRPSHEGDSHLPCGSGTQNCPMAGRKGRAAVKYTRPRKTRHAAC